MKIESFVIPFWIFSIAVFGYTVFRLIMFRRSSKIKSDAISYIPPREKRPANKRRIVEDAPELKDKIIKKADATKRKTLQPGNQTVVPSGYIQESDGSVSMVNLNKFSHKFYGAQLEVAGQIVVSGLPKKTHLIEIVDGLFYIDGQEYKINPSELDRIVRSIHADRL